MSKYLNNRKEFFLKEKDDYGDLSIYADEIMCVIRWFY
jgi:hypothetical protein